MKIPGIRWALVSVVAALAATAGCDGKPDRAEIPGMPDYAIEARMGPRPTRTQLDSLIAMKSRLEVTRDEYWEARGGVVANAHFVVWYPPGNQTITHAMTALDLLAGARSRALDVFGTVPEERLTVWCGQTMESYVEWADAAWWRYSRVEEDRIIYQPISVLFQRTYLDMAVPREYYVWVMNHLSDGNAPLWIVDGFASVLADEGDVLKGQLDEFPDNPVVLDPDAIDDGLASFEDKQAYRVAAFNAYMMTRRLVDAHGEKAIAKLLAGIGRTGSLEDATSPALGITYDELMVTASAWSREWSR